MELYQYKETNSLVEEFMLLANISTAKHILKHFPGFALLRRHPIPDKARFAKIQTVAEKMQVSLNVKSSKSLADSLNNAQSPLDPFYNTLLRILTTRCMTLAKYFSSGAHTHSEYYHYGLATPIYTHFTSPIRRYADVIVHRLLSASLGFDTLPDEMNERQVQRICNTINRSAKRADLAGRDSTSLFTLLFFKGKSVKEEAYVVNVSSNGFSVLVPRYGIEGVVRVKEMVFEEGRLKCGDVVISMLDKVQVEIFVDETKPWRPQLKIRCVEPDIGDKVERGNDKKKRGKKRKLTGTGKKKKSDNKKRRKGNEKKKTEKKQ